MILYTSRECFNLPWRDLRWPRSGLLPLAQCSGAMGSQASGDDDALSASLRRSRLGPSYEHDSRFENRNAEDVHNDALAAALAEHERIRAFALRTYELNELRLAQEKLRLHTLQEEERVRVEIERATEECRLRDIENKKKQIPVPAPRIKTPPPRAPSPPAPTSQPPRPPINAASQLAPASQKPPSPLGPSAPSAVSKPTSFQSAPPPAVPKPTPQAPTQQAPPVQPVQLPSKNNGDHILPSVERYSEIHQTLKKLRETIVNEGKQNLPFKKKTGEMRRAIRTSMGQLTGERGSNKQPVSPALP